MWRQQHSSHLVDEILGSIARRDERMKRPSNLVRAPPRRLVGKLAMPEATQQLQRQRQVNALGVGRPRHRPLGQARAQLVQDASGRLGAVEHKHELADRPIKQQADLARELRAVVRVVIEAEELVPQLPHKDGDQAVQHAVEVDLDPAVREVVVAEQLVAQAVGQGLGKRGSQRPGNQGGQLDLDLVGNGGIGGLIGAAGRARPVPGILRVSGQPGGGGMSGHGERGGCGDGISLHTILSI
ncbi:hypothetical protein MKX08_006750 [Trichoderma sp. CBMAI-0020]|nr:hypothetical protein MKX08_006750 [Trichoderma sp. CBMAI-0020]